MILYSFGIGINASKIKDVFEKNSIPMKHITNQDMTITKKMTRRTFVKIGASTALSSGSMGPMGLRGIRIYFFLP